MLTGEPIDWRRRREMTDALFDLQLELDVMLSPVVIPTQEWEHGVAQALPLRQEVDRDGVEI